PVPCFCEHLWRLPPAIYGQVHPAYLKCPGNSVPQVAIDAGGIRLSRTNREISAGTVDSGTETEESISMASRPSRDSPGQFLRIRIVGMSYILIVCEIDDQLLVPEIKEGIAASQTGKKTQ